MTIAENGKAFKINSGKLRVTCTGGDSLIEMNQDNTGFVPLSGGDVSAGVILDGTSFMTEDLGSADNTPVEIRFTGTGTVSYSRVK